MELGWEEVLVICVAVIVVVVLACLKWCKDTLVCITCPVWKPVVWSYQVGCTRGSRYNTLETTV